MDSRIGIGLGTLVIGLLVWNSWTVRQMQHRIDELESHNATSNTSADESSSQVGDTERLSETNETGQRSSRRSTLQTGNQSYLSSQGSLETSAQVNELIEALDDPQYQAALVDLMDDYFAEREEDQLDEGEANFLDYINEKVEIFSDDHDIDDATMGQMMQEIETRTAEYFEVMRQAKAGDMSWLEARPQMQAIRDQAGKQIDRYFGQKNSTKPTKRKFEGTFRSITRAVQNPLFAAKRQRSQISVRWESARGPRASTNRSTYSQLVPLGPLAVRTV